MPRPGQNEYRKRQRAEAEEEGSQDIGTEREKYGGPVLPVADLPDDWEGEAEDGATYLALVSRANAALPAFVSVRNPYRQPSPSPPSAYPDLRNGGYSPSFPAEPVAGPSRHPALPKDTWEAVFPTHFKSYRQQIHSRWPPSPPLPYPADYPPLPNLLSEPDWRHWMAGTPLTGRVKSATRAARQARKEALWRAKALANAATALEEQREVEAKVLKEVGPESAANGDGEEVADEDGVGEEDMDIELDAEMDLEEEALNKLPLFAPRLPREEEEDPVYPPPEPLVSVIQTFSSYETLRVLQHIQKKVENDLEPLERTVLPTQPDDPSETPIQADAEQEPTATPNPLSSHTARWIFALLAILDDQLTGDQISILRELARTVMRVGGWRWVRAVVAGEIPHRTPIPPSNSPGGADAEEKGIGKGTNWELGQRWKLARAALHAGPSQIAEVGMEGEGADERTTRRFPGYDETGVDETLARCWMIIHCISAGWAQRDLLEDLDTLFR